VNLRKDHYKKDFQLNQAFMLWWCASAHSHIKNKLKIKEI
jgi:hypothetical protein